MNAENAAQMRAMLARVPFVASLTGEAVDDIAGRLVPHTFAAGDTILTQGERAPHFILLVEGMLKVFISSASGDRMILDLLRAGDTAGLDPCLSDTPSPVSVEALARCTVLTMTREDVVHLTRSRRQFSEAALLSLSAAIGRRTAQLTDLVFLELHQRVAKMLLGLVAANAGASADASAPGPTVTLRLSLQDIAGVVGGQPDAVREVMLTFQQLGYIQLTGGHGILIRRAELLADHLKQGGSWAKLTKETFHDLLTGLPNRSLFNRRAAARVATARTTGEPGAILFIDLDDFKAVNDTLGHTAGDHLLAEVAARLARCIRPSDTPARFGGDEFGVLLGSMRTVQDAAIVARRIVEAVAGPFTLTEGVASVRASVGVAVFEGETDLSVEEILNHADRAMYTAKQLGKGRYIVYGADVIA